MPSLGSGTLPDAALAALAARGDSAAFEILLKRHIGSVSDLLRRMGADRAMAEDLTQDAFLAAWRAVGTWRGEASFGGWVRTIAARMFLKRGIREIRRQLAAEPLDATEGGPNPAPVITARLDLDRALTALTPAERLCVSLAHGAGLTHEEVAAALKMPLGTVKSHVARGLTRLRTALGQEARHG